MDLRFISLKVENLARSRKFYTKLLQKEPIKVEEGRMAEYKFEGVKLGIFNPEADFESYDINYGNNAVPAFKAENFEEEKLRISEFAEIVDEEYSGGHEWFTFKDPDGNILEVYQG